jgi:hypothetical protein
VDVGRAMSRCSYSRPNMRRACTGRASMLRPTVRQPCRRLAAEAVLRLHSDVQGVRPQRAAFAAPAQPSRLRCAPRARLAKALGQIKGVARRAPESQSARGFAAAPRGVSRVPCRHRNPHGCGVCRVPFAMACAMLRSRPCHGRP